MTVSGLARSPHGKSVADRFALAVCPDIHDYCTLVTRGSGSSDIKMRIINQVKKLPPIKALRRQRRHRWFESPWGYGAHHGVFSSFAEAAAAAPPDPHRFNDKKRALEYQDRLKRIFAYDYPILFWLQRIMSGSGPLRVLDIGGHVGVHYYAYGQYLEWHPEMTWRVCDVEEIVKAGRERAQEVGATALSFDTSFDNLDEKPADLVLSCGALHYVEKPLLWEVLAKAQSRPAHVLFTKIPLYRGESFVSLQNIGEGFSPHYVWNKTEFVKNFEASGYQLVNDWKVPDREFEIFDDPDRSFGAYSGMYLRRAS